MRRFIKDQKGNTQALLVILVVVLLLAAFYYFVQRQAGINVTNPYLPKTSSSTIQNDQGLMSASGDLDNTDLDALDKDLSQNDAEAANF